MTNFLNNNSRSLVHISLRDVLDNIYRLLSHWTLHKPFRSDFFIVGSGCKLHCYPIYNVLKTGPLSKASRRMTISPFGATL